MKLFKTKKQFANFFGSCLILSSIFFPILTQAQANFDPNFIISDKEMRDLGSWSSEDIQKFLTDKGSYLRQLNDTDIDGVVKSAAEIIYNAASSNKINPKFLVVTLQKEQSLITDDSPSQKQLDWATGYGVCDGCSLSDPDVQKHKGFATQVDSTASLMRWYYDNEDKSFVKKKDTPIRIDGTDVVPLSWATAFLYTYTPHLHGNMNFWRIWDTWFSQLYPDGSLLQADDSDEVWLIQNDLRRKFANKTALITRVDPKMVLRVGASDLQNYTIGQEITYPNYSILKTPTQTYLLDYDTLRPFASEEVMRKIGYNPEEIIEVSDADLVSYPIGSEITSDTQAPQGVIFKIVDGSTYFLFKDNILYPLLSKAVADINYKNLTTEKHKTKELADYQIAEIPLSFKDGTLLKIANSKRIYVMEKGKKRPLADSDTFSAMGYKKSNIATIDALTIAGIPEGDGIFMNASLISAKNKYLGDSEAPVDNLCQSKLPAYLVAEYPSGRIISGKNIDSIRPIASFVKLLTAYEAIQQGIDFNQYTAYSNKKYDTGDNILGLQNGEKIKNKDLFTAMLIRSANNTARMIAQATSLTEADFVANINNELADWGADNTKIVDVTGLDEKNLSSPRDLLKIFTKILTDGTIADTLSQTDYTFKGTLAKDKSVTHVIKNNNKLISLAGRNYRILANKTGYLGDSGYSMIMLIESKINKKKYTIITMGDSNYNKRFDEPNRIAQWIASGKVKISNSK